MPKMIIMEEYELFQKLGDLIDEKLKSVIRDPAPEKEELISRKVLMERLNISEPTVIRREKLGKIPFFKIGGSVRYDWNKVMKSLQKG